MEVKKRNYNHKFNKNEWLIIAIARECHLYTEFEKQNNNKMEVKKNNAKKGNKKKNN